MQKVLLVLFFFGTQINGAAKFADRAVDIDNSSINNSQIGFRFWKKTEKGKKQFVSIIRIIETGCIGTCLWDSTVESPEFVDVYSKGRIWTIRLSPQRIREAVFIKEITPVYSIVRKNNQIGDFCISIDELEKRKAMKNAIAQ